MKKITLISFIVFLIDRITKIFVTNYFDLNIRNKVINKFFYITNCHNTGAAFYIFSGNILFLILITFIVLYLIYKTIINKKNISNKLIFSYGLILGGILGNLFDRLFYGYVIDFLDFEIFNYNFAIFNVADIAIVCAGIMLILFEGSEKSGNKTISN